MKNARRVLPYLRPYKLLAAGSLGAIILASLMSLLAPWPLTILIDNVLGDKPLPSWLAGPLGPIAESTNSLLLFAVFAGLFVALMTNGVKVASEYVNTKLDQNIVYDFRTDLFQHVQRLSVAYTDQVSVARLMYGINFEAAAAGRLVLAIPPLAQSALTLIGMVWISFTIDPILALVSLLVVPVLTYAVNHYTKRIQPRLAHVKALEAESVNTAHEALSMLRAIVAFTREEHEARRFREQTRLAVNARVGITVRQTLFALVVNMSTALGTALVLGFGAYSAMEGRITAGQLLVVMAYVAAIYKPLEQISYTLGSLQDIIVGLGMGLHVLDTDPVVKDAPDATAVERAHGRVTFEGVHFQYPERTATLTDISFEVEPGNVVALVGPTGAGKTTLMSLIPRFYDVQEGRVLIDGIDVRRFTLRSLRDQISVVLQEPLLFSGTVAENIRFGGPDAPMEAVVEAAKAANAHDFIMALPNQYETTVGERGVQLSGGERQRICVARAFLKDAPILILDEPTSSIDSKTEAIILDALDRLMVGRTTFMIAHRLSTIRHSDVILVLNQGELVEQGTHEELLDREGLYKQLHEIQIASRRTSRRLLVPEDDLLDESAVSGTAMDTDGSVAAAGDSSKRRLTQRLPAERSNGHDPRRTRWSPMRSVRWLEAWLSR